MNTESKKNTEKIKEEEKKEEKEEEKREEIEEEKNEENEEEKKEEKIEDKKEEEKEENEEQNNNKINNQEEIISNQNEDKKEKENDSFEYLDVEQKYQELKLRINPKINININLKNKNEIVPKRTYEELYNLIEANPNQNINITNNNNKNKNQKQKQNPNLTIKEYYKLSEEFYAAAEKKDNYDENKYKKLIYKSPQKSYDNKSFIEFYSGNSEKKDSNKKNNYIEIFKPLTINSISTVKKSSSVINKKPQTQKRNNLFNKKYFRKELDNFNSLLFGRGGNFFEKNKENVNDDPFFSIRKDNKTSNLMNQGVLTKYNKKSNSNKLSKVY